ncbi:MAG: hypothetical protein Q7S27_00875 [Nanoarchaeota archaeon]|nr:hypothetical protein [Nanoarchaeota archaeon]
MKNLMCTRCIQVITDPVCISCFIKNINVWISEQTLKNEIKKGVLKSMIKEEEEAYAPLDISCILCSKDLYSICNYCFLKEAERVVRQKIKDSLIVNNFCEIFSKEVHEFGIQRSPVKTRKSDPLSLQQESL